mmetsp:Transcript_6042/g.15469  ORF Transcript_6042/g.15469 Transcript_6042/m.15469 type:complete len:200 (-) Transcript_6042:317-916(-)
MAPPRPRTLLRRTARIVPRSSEFRIMMSLMPPDVSEPMLMPRPLRKRLFSARTLEVEMLIMRPLQSFPALIAMQSSPLSKEFPPMYTFHEESGSMPSVWNPLATRFSCVTRTLLENVGCTVQKAGRRIRRPRMVRPLTHIRSSMTGRTRPAELLVLLVRLCHWSPLASRVPLPSMTMSSTFSHVWQSSQPTLGLFMRAQ